MSFPVIQYFPKSLKNVFGTLPFLVFPTSNELGSVPIWAQSPGNRASPSVPTKPQRVQSWEPPAPWSRARAAQDLNFSGSEPKVSVLICVPSCSRQSVQEGRACTGWVCPGWVLAILAVSSLQGTSLLAPDRPESLRCLFWIVGHCSGWLCAGV